MPTRVTKRLHCLLIAHALLLLIATPRTVEANDEEVCQVRLILFVPADVEVPPRYQERVNDLVKYTERFFSDGLARWGHDKVTMPFRYDQDGDAEVLLVRGKDSADSYRDPSLRHEAIATAIDEYDLDVGRQVWWIMVYVGDPPDRFQDFRGGFAPRVGGWSVCNFDTRSGRIRPDDPLGEAFLAELSLKGMIHELGHGFQLPHIGPRIGDDGGNSLMGPIHRVYWRIAKRSETRVYLSEAAAAMLTTHPAFRGVVDDRRALPNPVVDNLRFRPALDGTELRVTGTVSADKKPAYALVADESETQPGEYWTKTYVAPVLEDGSFEVSVTEPVPGRGSLKLWFAFENGASTGDGKRRGKAGAISRGYTYARRRWTFN